ncbi:hypothetical protein RRF57_003608 [Xylaria bambusicola]|uniref:Extracellular membrane protein CFEM domain-containing protein n=1 Tax=Xylaria bambusicola TaxID=326684 RepID=A0AAN7Z5J9_9PEZI
MRALLPAPLLLVLLLQSSSAFAIENDFSSYPEGAQSCLYDSADNAGCSSGATGAELNNCLCKNQNNFIYNTAGCVAKESPSDLHAVYETLKNNCEGTGVTLSVSKEAFLAAATAATQTTSILSPTTTSTSTTPSATGSQGREETDNGLNTGTKIGIGVGVGFGAIAAGLAAWFIWAYQRRRRSAHSVHSNEVSGGGAGPSYGGQGAFAMTNEFARDNTHAAAELAPVAWTPPTGYGMQGYTGSEDKNGRAAGVPLLAELGTESEAPTNAVELPATPGYLDYSDRIPAHANGRATPEGVSPATYDSQSRRGDLSQFAPSRSSDGGTYR